MINVLVPSGHRKTVLRFRELGLIEDLRDTGERIYSQHNRQVFILDRTSWDLGEIMAAAQRPREEVLCLM